MSATLHTLAVETLRRMRSRPDVDMTLRYYVARNVDREEVVLFIDDFVDIFDLPEAEIRSLARAAESTPESDEAITRFASMPLAPLHAKVRHRVAEKAYAMELRRREGWNEGAGGPYGDIHG